MSKNLTTLYKEARGEIEKIQRWRGGMMDKIRMEATKKIAMVHEVYMIDDVEAAFRAAAKQFCVIHEGADIPEDNIKEYIILPEGMIVVYNTPEEPRDVELNLTWEDIQYALDRKITSSLHSSEDKSGSEESSIPSDI